MRGVLVLLCLLAAPGLAHAQDGCRFSLSGAVMRLEADCVTTASIEIGDGITLDGQSHRIIARAPADAGFQGGILVARGATAAVVNTTIVAELPAGCLRGAHRLRGIYFEGAAGLIRNNIIRDIRRDQSSCDEGNAIEVRNTAVDGPPVRVEIEENQLDRYQKSAIVIHGNVEAHIRHNAIGASGAQALLAANSIQVGPMAVAVVEENVIAGNAFSGPAAAGTAVLLVGSGAGTAVRFNRIAGNADVGVYVMADGVTVEGNELLDTGADGYYDIGIADVGSRNVILGNTVTGFRTRALRMDRAPVPSGRQLE
jgi:hypothetical protein